MTECLVYGLIDPRTHLISYVGQSERGLARPLEHARQLHLDKSTAKKIAWVQELNELGLNYEIVVLERVCDPSAPALEPIWSDAARNPTALHESERWWIALGRAFGWPLLNQTDGGQGSSGYHHTGEARTRMSRRKLGSKLRPETRARMRSSALAIGDRHHMKRPEIRALFSGDNAPSKRPEVRAKISEARRRHMSDQQRRVEASARLNSPDAIVKRGVTMRGRSKRPESIVKRTETRKLRKERAAILRVGITRL